MTSLLDLFTSSGLGAALGLIGSWLTKREDRKNLELTLENKLKLARLAQEEALLEFQHERAMADVAHRAKLEDGLLERDLSELQGFLESQKQGALASGSYVVDAIRSLMRPLITTYLLILATLLIVAIARAVDGLESLGPDALTGLFHQAVEQILFLATTAVTWWFGSRPGNRKTL